MAKIPEPTITQIEYTLANYFDYTRNIVVPNISWGMSGLNHECDIFVMRPTGYCVEVEIKRSMSDLKADIQKKHCHESNKIKELWFCISNAWDIEEAKKYIPSRAGILTYSRDQRIKLSDIRQPKINTAAQPLTEDEQRNLLRLAHMRIWSMKRKIVKTERTNSNG